jgi:hypothetical protein
LERIILALERRPATSGYGVVETLTTRLRVPEPKKFTGAHDAKEVENFLWQMKEFLKKSFAKDEAVKVRATIMWLADDAIVWWRRRHNDMEKGLCAIDTYDDFKREL